MSWGLFAETITKIDNQLAELSFWILSSHQDLSYKVMVNVAVEDMVVFMLTDFKIDIEELVNGAGWGIQWEFFSDFEFSQIVLGTDWLNNLWE